MGSDAWRRRKKRSEPENVGSDKRKIRSIPGRAYVAANLELVLEMRGWNGFSAYKGDPVYPGSRTSTVIVEGYPLCRMDVISRRVRMW